MHLEPSTHHREQDQATDGENADAANAVRSFATETMSPRNGAPIPCDRSKNNENVPTAWLRSESGAAPSAALNSAGKTSDIPNPSTTAEIHTAGTAAHAATISAPVLTAAMATVEVLRHPTTSGIRAPRNRMAKTTPA